MSQAHLARLLGDLAILHELAYHFTGSTIHYTRALSDLSRYMTAGRPRSHLLALS